MKEKLLFVYPHRSSFIDLDLEILAQQYQVKTNTYNFRKKSLLPLYLFHQCFFLLFSIGSFKKIVVSFGGYWSFLPALFGKIFGVRTFIILHGTDATSFPEIGYGSLRRQPLRQFCKWSYQLAYRLLPVSKSLIYTENSYFKEGVVVKQGVKAFFPEVKTPAKVIPNGIEVEIWVSGKEVSRNPKRFVSVASGGSIYLKGIDLILEVSTKFPDVEFVIAGFDDRVGKYARYTNVTFLGRVSQEELKRQFYAATYYLQLSVSEGFGCALCEAMLCGCVPVVSNVNSLPAIAGEAGVVLEERSSAALTALLRQLLQQPTEERSILARQHIASTFSLITRREMLLKVLEA